MKKLIALSCLTALLLAGCGVYEPADEISKPDPVRVPTTEAAAEPETAEATITTTTAATTTPAETTVPASGKATFTDRLDSYADLYKEVVQKTWDEIYGKNDGLVSISYALYDIDRDQIPELLFKHGTCEADFRIDVYTVDLDARLMHIASLGGGHTSFARDEKTNELVLVWGHMGSMSLDWYTMDDDLNLMKTDTFSHELEAEEDYDMIMFDKGIWNMDFITAFSFDKDSVPKSYIYYAYSEYEEIDGLYLDFTYNGGAFR